MCIHDLHQGLTRQAMDGPGSTSHDGADAAVTEGGTSWSSVGNLDSLLVDNNGL